MLTVSRVANEDVPPCNSSTEGNVLFSGRGNFRFHFRFSGDTKENLFVAFLSNKVGKLSKFSSTKWQLHIIAVFHGSQSALLQAWRNIMSRMFWLFRIRCPDAYRIHCSHVFLNFVSVGNVRNLQNLFSDSWEQSVAKHCTIFTTINLWIRWTIRSGQKKSTRYFEVQMYDGVINVSMACPSTTNFDNEIREYFVPCW